MVIRGCGGGNEESSGRNVRRFGGCGGGNIRDVDIKVECVVVVAVV